MSFSHIQYTLIFFFFFLEKIPCILFIYIYLLFYLFIFELLNIEILMSQMDGKLLIFQLERFHLNFAILISFQGLVNWLPTP